MRTAVTLLCLLVCALAYCTPARARELHIDDMARIVDLEEPALSPDGRTVALLAFHEHLADATDVASLMLIDVRDGTTKTLLTGRDVAVPRWSPDGSKLAYLARPQAGGALQVYVRSGGRVTQLSHAGGDVIDVAWSPDGRRIAMVVTDTPVNAAALARHHDYFFAGDNDYTAIALTPPDHVWVVDVNGKRARRLTGGSWTVAPTDPGGIFSPQITWTADGSAIAFTRVENTFSGDDERSTIWQVRVSDGALRKLTGHAQFELSPSYSPDGARLVYWYPRDGDYMSENTARLLKGTADDMVAGSLDRNVASTVWYPGGRRLLVCASDRTRSLAWNVDVAGTIAPFPLHDLNIVCDSYSSSTFDAGVAAGISRAGDVAFLATDARHARELYLLPAGSTQPRQITHFNDFVAQLWIGAMTEFDWNGPDGFTEQGVVTYPPGFDAIRSAQPGKRFPLVLLIHGGPGLSSIRDFAWEQWPLAQLIASRGYIVFQPNYRGSDGNGNAFMHAIYRDTAKGPAGDIMSGLSALEHEPYVDSGRVAVSGWSYGGLLTTWLIGHYHTWRAAVSGAAVNDELEEYNLSTSNVQNTYYLGTSPYAAGGAAIYSQQSPATYYRQITTPTLVWGTTLDPVVPVPQSYSLYHALMDNHVPVRLLIFPASTHGPGNPVQTADLTRFWLDWLDRHV